MAGRIIDTGIMYQNKLYPFTSWIDLDCDTLKVHDDNFIYCITLHDDEIAFVENYFHKQQHDPVNHPKHYTQGGIEAIDVIKASLGVDGKIDFCLGNVLKYVIRNKHKDNQLEDLKKAQWYLNEAIKTLEEK